MRVSPGAAAMRSIVCTTPCAAGNGTAIAIMVTAIGMVVKLLGTGPDRRAPNHSPAATGSSGRMTAAATISSRSLQALRATIAPAAVVPTSVAVNNAPRSRPMVAKSPRSCPVLTGADRTQSRIS